ncbi:hypothetical protein PsPphi15_gp31 [Pseudomonas phage phi15]|uniref:Uncharacterized protein n=2 Tax=Troedvirus TaxID=2732694 RepID=A0A7G8LJ55_9CAUD|nr:hypothetical protein PsPphi15_gp31 [Pseudomonas phage phi15]QNJ57277.1 hypothetical protein Stalingrad_30 [Pseudomonas phage Stalingrad]CBZ42004.1 hypothetical protein [Pseudomonas phage phi15]
MLKEIQHYIDHPDDVPGITDAAATFLKVRLNPAYLMRTGVTDALQKQGWSDAKLMGFLEGLSAAVELVELMQNPPDTEDLPNVLQQ